MYEKSRQKVPDVPEITAEEVLRLKQSGVDVVLVDVRAPEEQAVSMIEGAITAQDFEATLDDHRDATIVAYCTVGGRSGQYAKQWNDKGLEVHNLKGAILSWTHVGGRVVDASGPTTRVHVWSPKANLVAEGYEGVW
jgi:sodium/bile acid cotransporter 7